MTHKFLVKSHYQHEDGDEFYVDGKQVGSTNYDEHGSAGMESARDMFEAVAKAIGAEYKFREIE